MATLTSNKNYLQPTGFKVVINRENYPNLEYFAQSVTHPGASVPPYELPVRRVTSVPLAGDKINYGELDVQIIVDEDLTAYKEMQSWLERTVNVGQVNSREAVANNQIPTYSDITVLILSSHNNKNVQTKYSDCIPTNIGSIEFSATSSEISYLTFNATFRFSTFVIS